MTYDTELAKYGREPVWIVELDLDYCSRTFGVAPCTAVLGAAGKCFNTRKTCQDAANYAKTTKTYRFSNVVLPVSSDPQFQAIPCVDNCVLLPTKIQPGKGIGSRSVMTVTLTDCAHGDAYADKYLSTRSYDSNTLGTLFTKLLARNPYYQGRTLRVRTGYVTAGVAPDAANFQDRTYQIERIEGPDKNGKVRIIAKDPLKLLDDTRSVAPKPSTVTLAAAINNTDGTLTLSPAGSGDALYPASGKICIESEVLTFTARAGDVLTCIRGANYTTAVAHAISTPVQLCLSYTASPLTTVVYDLLVNYAKIDASRIDLTAWTTEESLWLSDYLITAVVTKPIGVAALISELCEQCQFFIWWDERQQLIRLKAVRPWVFDKIIGVSDEFNIIADSQSVKDRPDDRVSELLFYYGQKDPTQELARPWNFQRIKVNTDADSETADQYGESRKKVVYSRWLTSSQQAQAVKYSTRTLNRYRNNPRSVTLRVDAKDSSAWTADVLQVTMRTITDYTGARLTTFLQILEAKEVVAGTAYEYTLEDTGFSGRYGLYSNGSVPTYASATLAQRATYGFWGDASGNMSDGSEGTKWA